MKKVLIAMVALSIPVLAEAQLMLGSIRPGGALNKADIMFQADFTPTATEYVNYLSISIAIPAVSDAGVIPSISTIGTPFSALNLLPATPFTYIRGSERIYSFIALNLSNSTPMVWTTTAFVGATVTFSGNPAAAEKIRLVDLTNEGGGSNSNTNFFVITNVRDATDYANFFYAIPGPTSIIGQYGNGDHWAETVGSVALPIELLSFTGYKDGIRNQLRWSTSIEQNNKGFDVLRSLDGVTYSSIGFVNSLANGGSSSIQLNYTFIDNNVSGSRQFYRLRQVDIGGNTKLSNIVLIKGDKPAIITIDGIFPNPATTTVNLMIGSPVKDKVSMQVTDMSGRTVMLRSLNVETGSNTLPVDVSALAGGTYMLRMTSSNGEVTTGKFIKQ